MPAITLLISFFTVIFVHHWMKFNNVLLIYTNIKISHCVSLRRKGPIILLSFNLHSQVSLQCYAEEHCCLSFVSVIVHNILYISSSLSSTFILSIIIIKFPSSFVSKLVTGNVTGSHFYRLSFECIFNIL